MIPGAIALPFSASFRTSHCSQATGAMSLFPRYKIALASCAPFRCLFFGE